MSQRRMIVKDIWNKDSITWSTMTLTEQLEALRKYHCSGPCGQSSSVLGTRSALDTAMKQAVLVLNTQSTEQCNHSWQHQETIKKTNSGDYNIEYIRIDRYYCQNCLEIKDLKKSEYSRKCPEWY